MYSPERLNTDSDLGTRPYSTYKSKFTHIHAPIHHKKFQPNEFNHTSYIKPPTYKSRFPYALDANVRRKSSAEDTVIPEAYSLEDRIRQKVHVENTDYHMQENLVDMSYVETIYERHHIRAEVRLGIPPRFRQSPIYITKMSSINSAIAFHAKDDTYRICILNFADSFEPGNGIKYGHKSQETSVCLQTCVYPTLLGNRMYTDNMVHGRTAEANDTMIYTGDVYLIRDEGCKRIDPFLIDVISSPPVDNSRRVVDGALAMMEERIRKIIILAAYKRNDILVLGDYGCGPFKNDPKGIARILHKLLVVDRMKDHFSAVVLPICYGSRSYSAFTSTFTKAKFF